MYWRCLRRDLMKKSIYDKIKEEDKKKIEEDSSSVTALFSQRLLAFIVDFLLLSILINLITMFVPVNSTATKLYKQHNKVN